MKIVAFDIETGSAADLHSYGPGFVRLCGWKTVGSTEAVTVSTDPAELVHALRAADAITAHNGINFDLLALASQGWISFDEYETLARKSFDTLIGTRHIDPVAAKGAQPNGYYQLGSIAKRYGLGGKDTVDFNGKVAIVRRVSGDATADKMVKQHEATAARLAKANADRVIKTVPPVAEYSVLKILADLYGGYDKIPQADEDYVRYLVMDVEAQCQVFSKISSLVNAQDAASRRYVRREHYVAASMGRITLEGSRIDVDLTMQRWSEGQSRLEASKKMLHEQYGMPMEGAYPHRTNAGKAAFRRAVLATGISEDALRDNWPTGKDGSLKTGKDVLDAFIPIFEKTKPAAAELCKTIKAFNGERTIYATFLAHLVGDHVHPYIGPDQSSGRWSMKDPGFTVMGKRGGKATERAIVLPDNDDEVLVAIDADQVDARVIAAECQDPAYMGLFAPGMDLHSEVAWRIWSSPADHGPDCTNVAPVKCRCEKRDQAKVFGHGFSYGLGANSMAAMHGVPIEVAQRFIQGMTEAFPRLAQWKDETRAAAGALAYGEEAPANDSYRILHTWAGRPIRVERARAYTQATAQVGQGGTRDVMAEAILKLPPQWRRKVRAVIHDEIVLSLPKEGGQELAQSIADGMAFDLKGVSITFGCSDVGSNWATCYGY